MKLSTRKSVENIRNRLLSIFRCKSVKSCMKMLVYTLTGSLPFRTKWMSSLINRLIIGAMIEIDGTIYYLVDSASFGTVQQDYERWLTPFFKTKPGDIYVDIGANIGKYSLKFAKEVGNAGLVIAIEPHPLNYFALVKGIALNNLGNIRALNVACWNKEGELQLHISEESSGGHSVVKAVGPFILRVKAKTIDNIVKELKLNKVDCMKIDVEGAELEVLQGGLETLKAYSPKVIVEALPNNRKKILSLMTGSNYKPKLIYDCEEFSYYYFEK